MKQMQSTAQRIAGMFNTVVAQILLLKAEWANRRKVEQPYELSAELTCAPNGIVTTNSLLIPANGDFLMEGYNVSYEHDGSGKPTLQLKLTDENGNVPFSPDMVPIELVATPGMIVANVPPVRYGMRPWTYLLSAKSALRIEVRNNSTVAVNLKVRITISGRLLKATAQG